MYVSLGCIGFSRLLKTVYDILQLSFPLKYIVNLTPIIVLCYICQLNGHFRPSMIFLGASQVVQMVKNLPAMQETQGLIPILGGSPGEGNGYPR